MLLTLTNRCGYESPSSFGIPQVDSSPGRYSRFYCFRVYFYTIESLAQLIKHASVNSARLFHSHLATVSPRFVLRFHRMFANFYGSTGTVFPLQDHFPAHSVLQTAVQNIFQVHHRTVPSDVDDTRLMTTFPSGARADDHRPKPRFRTTARTGSSADAKKRTVSPLLLLFRRATTTTTIELPTGPVESETEKGTYGNPVEIPGI